MTVRQPELDWRSCAAAFSVVWKCSFTLKKWGSLEYTHEEYMAPTTAHVNPFTSDMELQQVLMPTTY